MLATVPLPDRGHGKAVAAREDLFALMLVVALVPHAVPAPPALLVVPVLDSA
jgi:hypothetical protein